MESARCRLASRRVRICLTILALVLGGSEALSPSLAAMRSVRPQSGKSSVMAATVPPTTEEPVADSEATAEGNGLVGDFRAKKMPAKGLISIGRMLEIHKACWLPLGLVCMAMAPAASVLRTSLMTGMFGAYGVCWVLKSYLFPDLGFYNDEANHFPLVPTIINFALIGLYFLFPILAMKNTAPLSPIAVLASPFFFVLGAFFHYGGDAQKYFTLRESSGLITDGFFSKTRHPSYLGEFMMWIGLTILAGPKNPLAYLPIAWLALATVAVGIPKKEASLSRYPKFEAWKASTGAIIPKFF